MSTLLENLDMQIDVWNVEIASLQARMAQAVAFRASLDGQSRLATVGASDWQVSGQAKGSRKQKRSGPRAPSLEEIANANESIKDHGVSIARVLGNFSTGEFVAAMMDRGVVERKQQAYSANRAMLTQGITRRLASGRYRFVKAKADEIEKAAAAGA